MGERETKFDKIIVNGESSYMRAIYNNLTVFIQV